MKSFSGFRLYAQAMSRYATFSGRSMRAEFWYFTLVSGLMGIVAALLDRYLHTGGGLNLLVSLIHTVPSLSVFVRRLHDTDHSGWWFLALFSGILTIPVIVFLCQRSMPAANRYGAPLNSQLPGRVDGAPTASLG